MRKQYLNIEYEVTITPAIEVSSLSKDFAGRTVVDSISFSVIKGEIFGYLGPNGAGKTTTMRILLGLLAPTSGRVRVLDADLARDDAARKKVGVLLENNGLYERLTAEENLRYFARLYGIENPKTRVEELLDFSGLLERSKEPVGNFSTGMKRKLGIARAILHNPEIVFLDEPTKGLDPEAQHMVRELILRLSGSGAMTVFLNSHNLDEVQRICSRVAILHQGKIQALDSVRHLTAGSGRIHFTVTLADPGKGSMARDILSGLDGISDVSLDGDKISMELVSARPHSVVSVLVRGGIEVDEARKEGQSLEEIYLAVMRQGQGDAA
ncbi:MAG TPA: ABC transporter ATP-binding protein [Methanoregulaceae archaeon]|nr:ABC transporter ATP-binding protein [Methanoregulaceae archaeon]